MILLLLRRRWFLVRMVAASAGLAWSPAASAAVTYSFSTLGGATPVGSADGVGAAARFWRPEALAFDASGNCYVADTENHTIRKITPQGSVSTLAGLARASGADDGAGSTARFSYPRGVATDSAGNVYVGDTGNSAIRRITPTGLVSTLAGRRLGNGFLPGFGDGPGAAASFFLPQGVGVDASGSVYVADTGNNAVRRISAAGVVTTIAGSVVGGSVDGPGLAARFLRPVGLAFDVAGNLYVADSGNHTIRKLSPAGAVTTVAGVPGQSGALINPDGIARFSMPYSVAIDPNGLLYVCDAGGQFIARINPAGMAAHFLGFEQRVLHPTGLALDPGGNLWIADSGNHVLRRVTPEGVLTTPVGLAPGSADGTGAAARFHWPIGMAVASNGNVYVADNRNNTIRQITPAGVVTTLAGDPTRAGHVDGVGSAARFSLPNDVAIDGAGTLYVAANAIRKVSPGGAVSTLVPPTPGFVPAALAVDPSGNVFVIDPVNRTIHKVTPAGALTLFAGVRGPPGGADGPAEMARFDSPTGIAVDRSGFVYVSEFSGAIRKITPAGVVSTLAGVVGQGGHVDGVGAQARFRSPRRIAVDAEGTLYVAENTAIRRVTPEGVVTTIGGADLQPGSADGTGAEARFREPQGIAVDANGNLHVADTGNNLVRRAVRLVVEDGPPARLVNLSLLTNLNGGGDAFTLGYVVGGAGTFGVMPILLRAAGPSLSVLGLTGVLGNPRIEVFTGSLRTVENDDWGGSLELLQAFSRVGAFPFAGPASRDAAILTSNPRGDNSVKISSTDASSGTVLAEVYDATPAATVTAISPRLINVSVYKDIGDGFTVGFVVAGAGTCRVLLRAIGPGLAGVGVTAGTLADPRISLFQDSSPISENDDWGGRSDLAATMEKVGAFPLIPSSRDAVITAGLAPGSYSARVSAPPSGSGSVLVEVYEVP